MSRSSDLMADLDAVGDIVARTEADLTAGAILDLAPLESHIHELCTRIEGLPPGEGRALHPKLLALADDFGRLGQSIGAAMSEAKAQIGEISGRQRAASAYAKSSEPNK